MTFQTDRERTIAEIAYAQGLMKGVQLATQDIVDRRLVALDANVKDLTKETSKGATN